MGSDDEDETMEDADSETVEDTVVAPGIVRDPELLSGAPAFAGTRIFAVIALDYLALEKDDYVAAEQEFLEDFPYLSHERVLGAIAYGAQLVRDYHERIPVQDVLEFFALGHSVDDYFEGGVSPRPTREQVWSVIAFAARLAANLERIPIVAVLDALAAGASVDDVLARFPQLRRWQVMAALDYARQLMHDLSE